MNKVFTFSSPTLAIAIAAILISAFALPSIVPIQYSKAWNTGPGTCNYEPGDVVTWKRDTSLSGEYYPYVRNAVALWNNVGANIRLVEVSSSSPADVIVHEVAVTPPGHENDLGWSENANCSNNPGPEFRPIEPTDVYLNREEIQSNTGYITSTAAHELGHALWLWHNEADPDDAHRAIMFYQAGINGIVGPTLDDVRGLQSSTPNNEWDLYGKITPTAMCTWQGADGGQVNYLGGTCTTSNPAYPVAVKCVTSLSTCHAYSRETLSTTSLPSSGVLLMYAKVRVKTLTDNPFVFGIFTTNDFRNQGLRFMSIEMNEDGFKLVKSTSTGLVTSIPIFTGTLVDEQIYFIELIIRNSATATAYVFKDDGNFDDPPTYLGSATTTVSRSWGSVHYGTGTYITITQEPQPWYMVTEYRNHKLSWN